MAKAKDTKVHNGNYRLKTRVFGIETTYSFKREIMKVNVSTRVDLAILNCIKHMQRNDYRAAIAEIHDRETGKLYAVITRNMRNQIKILYKDVCISDGVFVIQE